MQRNIRSGYRGDDLTPILVLVILCFIVFIATQAGNFFDYNLFNLLGFQPASFLSKPWTILTNLFVHHDIWHLLANMITLFFFGRFLSGLVGTRAFFSIDRTVF